MAPCLIASVAVVATGCPTIQVAGARMNPESIEPGSFTLELEVVVDQKEADVDDDGREWGGRGLVAVWMPEGWKSTGARMIGREGGDPETLQEIGASFEGFPRTFPHVPGEWQLFVTSCQYVPVGRWSYGIELDVEMPEDDRSGSVGVTATIYDPESYAGPSPVEVKVDLDTASAVIVMPPEPAAVDPEGGGALPECQPVERGPRGCHCDAAGRRNAGDSTGSWLVALIRGALEGQ